MRHDNWPSLLNKYLTDNRNNEWKWGTHDCCTFAAGAVEAITGVDYMEEFRGHYSSEDSSNQALTQIGVGTLYDTLKKKFGPPVHGAKGKRGDVAFSEGCCGIVIGKAALFIREDGWGLIYMTQIEHVFQVV